jgi:hypothetical protein
MLGAIRRHWDRTYDVLVPLLAVLAYALWAHPLFALFLRDPLTGQKNSRFTFWLCLGTLTGGLLAGRLARWRRAHVVGVVVTILGGLCAVVLSLALVSDPSKGGPGPIGWLVGLVRQHEREIVPAPLVMLISTILLWSQGVRLASAESGPGALGFSVGVIALAGQLCLAFLMPSVPDSDSPGSVQMLHVLSYAIAPMVFLVSLPLAVLFFLFSRLLGEWAATLGQAAIVVGMVFLAAVLPVGASPESLIGPIFLFLACGLAALALGRVSRALHEQERITGVRSHVDGYWLLIALSIIIVILLAGLLVGQAIAPGTIARGLNWLWPLWALGIRAFLSVVLALAYLFFGLIEALPIDIPDRLLALFTRFVQWLSQLLALVSGEDRTGHAPKISPVLYDISRVFIIIVIISIIVVIVLLALRQRRKGTTRAGGVLEIRSSILSWSLIRSQLRNLFRRRRKAQQPPLFLALDLPDDPRQIVRRIYQTVLARAMDLGAPRPKGQTPDTYLGTLLRLCPGERESLETLTLVYEIARYGSVLPTRDQLRATQEAFLRIELALQSAAPEGVSRDVAIPSPDKQGG